MEINVFETGPFAENTYLITKEGQSLLIDPGFFYPQEFTDFTNNFAKKESELTAVLLTHAHVDHVFGLERVLKEFDVPVFLNHTDLFHWKNFASQAYMFGIRTSDFDFTPRALDEQKNFELGNFICDVLFTPGHAPEHVSLYFKEKGVLIAGDLLFKESIGRTDLYKGNFDQLAASIREKLYVLPDDTQVYPGHGPATTIGHEKKHNPFVKARP